MQKLKRYMVFFVGIMLNALGIGIITKANLGISPISSIPNVLSLAFPLSLGQFTILFSLMLIVIQLAILGKNFRFEHILQIPVSFILGYLIDIFMLLLVFMEPQQYLEKAVYLLLGCAILGTGVYLEVLADVVMLPGESVVRSIVARWSTDFGTTKVAIDVTMAVVAIILSFAFSGKLMGVREGTLVAALLVGFIARQLGRRLNFMPRVLFGEATA